MSGWGQLMADEQGQNVLEQKAFDYSVLNEPTRMLIQTEIGTIRMGLKRTSEGIVSVGQSLMKVKEVLEHGQFQEWLSAEFEMTYRMALNFMRVAERFGDKSEIISHLPVTILYELAAPSTSDEVVEGVLEGEIHADLKSIREAKGSHQKPKKQKKKPQPGERFPQLLLPGAKEEQWRQGVLKACRNLTDAASDLLEYFHEVDMDKTQQEVLLVASLETVQGHEDLLYLAHLLEEARQSRKL